MYPQRVARLLIVEDSPTQAELLQLLLESEGYQVLVARDGLGGLALARQHQPDLILSDIHMPGMDGLELTRTLKTSSAVEFTPLILMTTLQASQDRLLGLEAGADDFLTKPVDKWELIGRVRSLLRIKFLHDEVARQTKELQRFVSLPTADMIRDRKEIRSGLGEIRDFAILFSDMRGFTALADKFDPTVAFRVLSQSLKLQAEVVLRHAGNVDKIYGDGFLAYFEGDDRVARALRCALRIKELTQAMPPEDDVPVLPVGLAVNVGPVLFGMLGANDRVDHTVAGDVVNVCARLCGHAQPFQIVVTAEVRQAARRVPGIRFHALGAVSLKGKPEPTPIFEVRPSEGGSDDTGEPPFPHPGGGR